MPPEIRKSRVMKIHRSMPFTLIELLVVIAIIAIMAGFLLPALKHAKDMAYTKVSVNNEKQIFSALMLYADDYDNHVPKAWDGSNNWYWHLSPVSGHLSVNLGYLSSEKVLECPVQVFTGASHRYGMNNYGITSLQITNTKLWRNHSAKVFVADSRGMAVGSSNGSWRWADNITPYTDLLDGRHSGGANILYADGHVDWISQAEKPHLLIDEDSWDMDR